MSIKDKTLQNAIKLLDVLGCQYAIIDHNGDKWGGLETAKPKPVKRKLNNFKDTGYIEQLKTMQVGDVLTFVAPEGKTANQYRGAISGTACNLWGAGSSTTSVNGNAVEILRIS